MKKMKSILALLLCFAIVFSFFVFFNGEDNAAEAATSLPGIEKIKQNSDTFNILEIVPEAGSGSIGWYINGQEPGANWAHDQLASIDSSSARATAAADYLAALESAGLLGVSGTPLFKTGNYEEYFPWSLPADTSGLNSLSLSSEEPYTLTSGAFTEVGTGGEYRADNIYTVADGGTGGDYDQDISALSFRETEVSDGETHYYCTLESFSPLTAMGDISDGIFIYRVLTDEDGDGELNGECNLILEDLGGNNYNQIVSAEGFTGDPENLIFLSFEGCVGSSYLTGLNLLEDYFEVSFTVGTDFDETQPQYEATAYGFVHVDAGCGHFNASTVSYTYVGLGSAEATHSYSSDGTYSGPYSVNTGTVFYTGGFINNNWFLTYVFDWESGESAPAITVKSVTPGGVTTADVSGADMIVLSNGRENTAVYASGNDISGDVETAVSSVSALKVPIIVDNALCSLVSLNIGQLAGSLTSGSVDTHYVDSNIYCVDTALATNAFNSAIAGDHENADDPFYAVWYEINYENFLRTQNDPDTVTLSETVTIARCVRYIINYGGQREISKKTSIRVLELQPGRGGSLTVSQVSGWTGVDADKITIDTMSTSEFIGKIDDLVETYDLVYMGSDLEGFNTTGSGDGITTVYNDNAMNGLIYCNIGDTWVTDNYKLSGILDRDYSASSTFYIGSDRYNKIDSTSTARKFRFSGNDLTAGKVSELLDYAAAGYPIVVSDELMAGAAGMAAFSFYAELSAYGENGLKASTTAAAGSIIPTNAATTYQWYMKNGNGDYVATSTSSSINLPDEAGTYSYYCDVTITSRGEGYTSASNTATVTVEEEPYSANPSTDYNHPRSGSFYVEKNYTVTINRTDNGGSYTYSISVSPDDYNYISYRWYRLEEDGFWFRGRWISRGWYEIYTGDDNPSHLATDDSRYFCKVNINGGDWRNSQYADPSGYEDNNPDMTYPTYTATSFDVIVSPSPDSNGVILTASCDPDIGDSLAQSFTWYKKSDYWWQNDVAVCNTASTPYLTSGTYYCRLSIAGSSAYSANYTIGVGNTTAVISFDGNYEIKTVPAVEASYDVSTSTVDYCSNVFTFLSTVTTYANTFTEAGASLNSSTLIQYLNLSKPKIVLTSVPTTYTGPSGEALTPGATLSYTFTIQNETDVTPAETRYFCNFYIDTNADGRYSYYEQLADIRITDAVGNVVRSGELRADTAYTVTRTMPDKYVGIIPWELEVVKAGQDRVHASEHGYSRIAPAADSEKTTINILQILNGNTIGSSLNLITNSTYLEYFPDADDFNLVISTVTMNTLNGNGPYNVTTRNVSTGAYDSSIGPFGSRTDLFEHYDMLILGFADCYGDLNNAAANAVVDFIDSGKSVLFTHDTTSICNLPFDDYQTTTYGTVDHGYYYWGYYFNAILRSAVGLDRYGVTDPHYGVTSYSPNKDTSQTINGINVAAGGSALGPAAFETLTNAGYSIAYKPVSGGTEKNAVDEVQGAVYLALTGQVSSSTSQYKPTSDYFFNKLSGNYITASVSQVNEGQITTYPFNLNTQNFTDETNTGIAPLCNSSTMTIAQTHNQYYQLNMNSDDIVVWYCLSDGSLSSDDVYGFIPNDVINNYYIYSMGNVTYSGAGHSGNSASDYEAKLFINTMIAAYRTATTPPEISIVDPGTGEVMTDKFYVGDDTSLLASSGNSLADSAVYFTVTDPSLGAGKVIDAAFFYEGNGIDLKIYVKGGSASPINYDSNNNPTTYTLSGGVTYYIYPSAELLAYIQEHGSAVLTVTITSNLLPSQPASAQITLHELGLFPMD